jgi:hypothetical protein
MICGFAEPSCEAGVLEIQSGGHFSDGCAPYRCDGVVSRNDNVRLCSARESRNMDDARRVWLFRGRL